MIESIEFANFKALRSTTLPLAPFTLLLGPNGSGKSTVLQALGGISSIASGQQPLPWPLLASVTSADKGAPVEVRVQVSIRSVRFMAQFAWRHDQPHCIVAIAREGGVKATNDESQAVRSWLRRMRTYSLNPDAIAMPAVVSSGELQKNGGGLAAVLDDLKDNHPERWNSLLAELSEWLPEFDHILFEKPQQGQKALMLRTRRGGYRIPARDLSQGTLVGIALLTLCYLPDPPVVIGLEEIDRGLHPRLLRHLQDALYRLSYPQDYKETRSPVQVIATTHSPYLLDLYREHPKEIVLAQKKGLEVEFKRLTDIEHYQEILGDSPLSDVWYSGVLGGVSVEP